MKQIDLDRPPVNAGRNQEGVFSHALFDPVKHLDAIISIQEGVFDEDRVELWQITRDDDLSGRKEIFLDVALYSVKINFYREVPLAATAFEQGRQKLFDDSRPQGTRLEIVIRFDALADEIGEDQRGFIGVFRREFFNVAFAVKGLRENKRATIRTPSAVNRDPSKVIQEYQSAESLMERVLRLEQSSKTLEALCGEAMPIVCD
ncbi:MAG: hypothetical protein O2960_15970 [Verrucomicrobia bacterium]|nr:hypothetical protein [Verrucomicrobiota bacterium]